MILSGQTIKQFIQEERILITPFSDLSVQPASIDLRLGEHFLVVDDMSTPLLSVDKPASYHETQVPEGGVISMTSTGKYSISILTEYEKKIESKKIEEVIGIDFAMDGLFVDSEGKKANYPRFYRQMLDRLAKEQRILSNAFE